MLSLNTNISAMIGLAAVSRHDQEVNTSLERLTTGQKNLSDMRAGAGMRQKELESNLRQYQEKFQDLSDARSQIMDTDYASETAEYMRASMLRDVSTFVTGLALKQSTDTVLMLLKPLGMAAAA